MVPDSYAKSLAAEITGNYLHEYVTSAIELHPEFQKQMTKTTLMLCLLAWPGAAQDALSLKDAVLMALDKNPAIVAAGAVERGSERRIVEARSGKLPKINYSESWTRSDNPVFVFSSLLSQGQFGQQNFQIGPLNRPDYLNNFQSRLTADQMVYDAGRTKLGVRSAEINREMTREEVRRTRMDVVATVIRCWFDALLGRDQLDVTTQAMKSVEADLERAEAVRMAGMSTDADVLSIRVHLASVHEQLIRRGADLEVARAALNDAIGLPLDAAHTLPVSLTAWPGPDVVLAEYERLALAERPEVREVRLANSLAGNEAAAAKGNLRPEVMLHGALEADRQRFYDRGGANAMVSVELRWNLFNGFADQARIAQGDAAMVRTRAEEARAASAIRLQVRRAYADLRSARERIEVTKATVTDAEESLRITRNRYQAGFAGVTDLLRTETAVTEARSGQLGAIRDQRVAAAMLELAAGTLSADSEVLR